MWAGLFSALIAVTPASAFGDLWQGWTEVKNDGGIRIWKRAIPNSPLLEFGGETVFEADVGRLCSVLEDLPGQLEWVDSLAEIRALETKSPRDYVYLQRFSLPWPFTDREFVVRHQIEVEPEKIVFHEHSVDSRLSPPGDCCVRAQMELADVYVTPLDARRTAVAAIARVDLAGSIPAWLANWVQEDFPMNTLLGYKKQLSRGGLVLPACRELVTAN